MDRETGVISRRGQALEGVALAGKIVCFPAVQGGVAAGWAFLALTPDPFTVLRAGDRVRMAPRDGMVERAA